MAANCGDAFQRFCFELLRRTRPGLHSFATSGKDGGIDLVRDGERGREVVECKHVGEDGLAAARARWRTVAKALAAHLPARDEAQYAPWWKTDPPICKYTFCLSSSLGNQAQVDQLRQEIGGHFAELAAAHAHLRHLGEIEIEVLHWPDLVAELGDQPSLVFRWFPRSRPLGMVPIGGPAPKGRFSSFLDSATLDYYSRDRHIEEYGLPHWGEIEGEVAMLERLSDVLGLIVTGSGGHGKTRLVHELGVLAQERGWCVLRVSGAWRQQSLERLATMVGSSAPVLLLFDYVETVEGFDDAVADLLALHETYGLEIRYVANCRSSYYPRIAHLPQHDEVPLASDEGNEWFVEFRRRVVRHILEAGGVGADSRSLEVCRDVPVLAVFLVYLSDRGKTEDLSELLAEADFGRWLAKRLSSSFPDRIDDDLPRLVAQFPMRHDVALRSASPEVLGTLEVDGWIETQQDGGDENGIAVWSVIHDVLADQLLISWLARRGSFAGAEVEEILDTGLERRTLGSLVSSMQRIRESPEVADVPFGKIIRERFARNPEQWIAAVPSIISSPLLSVEDAIALLGENEGVWRGQIGRRMVRQQVGWLAREVSRDPNSEAIRLISPWLWRALGVEESDYLLRSALLLDPRRAAARAKAWIEAHQTDFSTYFVITAWLEKGLPYKEIEQNVIAWLEVHGRHVRAWFVLSRWLGPGADPTVIEARVLAWLESHHTIQTGAARVLYRWLREGGSREAIDRYAIGWLTENVESSWGSNVLGGWLEAGADPEVARPFVERWMRREGHVSVDRLVYLSWLNAGGDPELIRESVEGWLEDRPGHGESWYVMDLFVRAVPKTRQLVEAMLGRWGGSSEIRGFGEVLRGWLLSGGSPDLLAPHLDDWLSRFGEDSVEAGGIYAALLGEGRATPEMRAAAVRWFLAFPTEVQAGHICKQLAGEEKLAPDEVRAVLRWCEMLPADPDALWRLSKLGQKMAMEGLGEQVMSTIEAVARAVLPDPTLSALQAMQLTSIASHLSHFRELNTGVTGDRCDAFLLEYLRHPCSFQHGGNPLPHAARPIFVRRVFSLMLRGWLDPEVDSEGLQRLLDWVQEWEEPYRGRALHGVFEAVHVYPLSAP